jgi:hypothetical protein
MHYQDVDGPVQLTEERAQHMAEDRRLLNKENDDPWGHRADRHGRDEATAAATSANGGLGETVIG